MAISPLQLPSAPMGTQRPSAPAAPPPPATPAAPQDNVQTTPPEADASGAQGLLGGLVNNFTRLNLDEEQLESLKDASPTLEKLAGEDGVWGPSDLADNVQAFKGDGFNPLAGVVEKKLRAGFEEMTGKPVDPLTDEQKGAAKERWDKFTPEEKRANKLTTGSIKRVGEALETVKESTPLSKLGGKTDGIPGDFLSKVAENPTVPGLMKARSGGKKSAPAAKKKAAPKPKAPAPRKTAPSGAR